MSAFRALADATYISIESYRRNGAARRTPVWIVGDGDRLYCWTQADSGKVKRIRNNPRVKLANCDARGKILGDWVDAEGQVRANRSDVKQQARRMRAKYGWKFLFFRYLSGWRGASPVAIEFVICEANAKRA